MRCQRIQGQEFVMFVHTIKGLCIDSSCYTSLSLLKPPGTLQTFFHFAKFT